MWSCDRGPQAKCLSVYMIFRIGKFCLNFVLDGNKVCIHSMNCCFDQRLCTTHVLLLETIQLMKSLLAHLYPIRKGNELPFCLIQCCSISIFTPTLHTVFITTISRTQFNELVKVKFEKNVGKVSDVRWIICSLILRLTEHTKSTFNKKQSATLVNHCVQFHTLHQNDTLSSYH